ncbi:hypothetical protein D3C87_1952810 [compost metagenome]
MLEDDVGENVLAEMQVIGIRRQVFDPVIIEATNIAGQRETKIVFIAPGRNRLGIFEQAQFINGFNGGG